MTADQADAICPDCEPHDDGGFTCDPKRERCPYPAAPTGPDPRTDAAVGR